MSLHQQDFSGSLRAVAIFGPGLIGGSLGLALRAKFPGTPLRFWTRPASLDAVRQVFPDATTEPAQAVDGAEVVVFCTPVGSMRELAAQAMPHLREDCLVTDAGSTKQSPARELGKLLGQRFVPAHPMAGSEMSGLAAARADLFEGALCLLTPGPLTGKTFLGRAEEFWRSAGCRTRVMSPAEHDRLVARASHLPHAVAAALISAVAAPGPEALEVSAGGLRDTTRVAAGPAGMWAEILLDNRHEVLAALGEFRESLGVLSRCLREDDREGLASFLADARRWREALP